MHQFRIQAIKNLGYVEPCISWANVDPDLCHHMKSIEHNELRYLRYLLLFKATFNSVASSHTKQWMMLWLVWVTKNIQQLGDHQGNKLNHGLIDENWIHCADYIIRFYMLTGVNGINLTWWLRIDGQCMTVGKYTLLTHYGLLTTYRSRSILPQVMACQLTSQDRCLKQCWLIIIR